MLVSRKQIWGSSLECWLCQSEHSNQLPSLIHCKYILTLWLEQSIEVIHLLAICPLMDWNGQCSCSSWSYRYVSICSWCSRDVNVSLSNDTNWISFCDLWWRPVFGIWVSVLNPILHTLCHYISWNMSSLLFQLLNYSGKNLWQSFPDSSSILCLN